MFDFDSPTGREQAQLRHVGFSLAGVLTVIATAWVVPRPGGAPGSLKAEAIRFVLDWGPALAFALTARASIAGPGSVASLVAIASGAIAAWTTGHVIYVGVGALVGAYFLLALRVADQWEKYLVLRFGRYHALRGPGMFFIVPIVDRVSAVIDERVRTTDVHSEAAVTRDTLRVNVDAVVFWQVWDAGKAALEVQDFDEAVGLVAQASLLESIGRHELAQVLAGRESLGCDLRQVLQEKTTPWGITVQSVEIRDIRLPRDLEDVMSRQAQAERERQARIILGTSEVELAAQFAQASEAYKNDPTALHLRAMNMLYEVLKEKGSMVVVPASSLKQRARRRKGAAVAAHSS